MNKSLFAVMAVFSLFLSITATAPLSAEPVGWNSADWDLEDSEFVPEDGWHFGKLENGFRYIIRRNNRPENTAMVRMIIKTGSIDEEDHEQGFAHYVEHMAFNGSTNIPEGEMVKLLEREGLAFGADTNASTGFERTQYRLDLPRADEGLLDTALMLMRETASELTIAEDAVERERGIILSERRVRNGYDFKSTVDRLKFNFPGSRISRRLPIGTIETLEAATGGGLRAFWEREYVPADTVLIVVGDFDPALVEEKIQSRFADWEAKASADQPDKGPVDPSYSGETDIHLDPALSEGITLLRHAAYIDRPDTLENRRSNVLRAIGTGALNRRMQRLQRSEDPPFRGASFSATNFFEEARSVSLSVRSEEGGWKRGLDTLIDEYRRALQFGFSQAEIAEQVANYRTGAENRVANAATRSNGSFAGNATSIARGMIVPTSPQSALERFEAIEDQITPENVLAAMRERFFQLEDPLIRFTGKTAPEGGANALRSAVQAAYARELKPPEDSISAEFAYTDFGPAGKVVSDTRNEALDIRTIRFANGVMLNLKPTDLEDNRIRILTQIDGGRMLRTKDDPLALELTGLMSSGGLGQHSRDELQSILAGRSVGASLGASGETFVSSAITTPRDFQLQLQLMTAFLIDPGYRAEGLGPWRKGLDDYFARLGKTPGSAYGEASRRILSDNDPRFSRQPIESYRALNFDRLRTTISERLANGALEIGIVGDFTEEEAIELVGQTLGTLPQRETKFRTYTDGQRQRSFTQQRGLKLIEHDGEADQSRVSLIWPTTDDEDVELVSRMNLLSRVTRLLLTEKLREELGQTYSPGVSSSLSGIYDDYGTFSVSASVDVEQLDAAHQALVDVINSLIETPPDEDLIQRAKQPILEGLENALKSNNGWMRFVDRAQSKPEDIERFLSAPDRYNQATGEELQSLAQQYLNPDNAVQFRVVPSATAKAKAAKGNQAE